MSTAEETLNPMIPEQKVQENFKPTQTFENFDDTTVPSNYSEPFPTTEQPSVLSDALNDPTANVVIVKKTADKTYVADIVEKTPVVGTEQSAFVPTKPNLMSRIGRTAKNIFKRNGGKSQIQKLKKSKQTKKSTGGKRNKRSTQCKK